MGRTVFGPTSLAIFTDEPLLAFSRFAVLRKVLTLAFNRNHSITACITARKRENDHCGDDSGLFAQPSFGASGVVRATSLFFAYPNYRDAMDTIGQSNYKKSGPDGIETVHNG